MTPTSIYFIISRGDVIGGAQVHVITLSKLARDNGLSPTILSGHENGDLSQWCCQENIPHIFIPGLSNDSNIFLTLKSFFSIYILLSVPRAIFSFHSSKAGAIGRLISIFTRTKIFYTVHGWNYTKQLFSFNGIFTFLIELLYEILFSFNSHLIFVSNFDKNHRPLPFMNLIYPNSLIYNTVTNITSSYSHTSYSSHLHIGMIGRFTNQKSQSSLLSAIRLLPSVTVDFVGDGYNLEQCIDLADYYGISDQVNFLGRLSNENARSSLSRWDIYLLISNWEGFPRSLLESIASATPIISSNVGGCSEFFTSSYSKNNPIGILLTDNKPETIASAISFYLDHPKLISVHGKNARCLYQSQFSFQAFSASYLSLWSSFQYN